MEMMHLPPYISDYILDATRRLFLFCVLLFCTLVATSASYLFHITIIVFGRIVKSIWCRANYLGPGSLKSYSDVCGSAYHLLNNLSFHLFPFHVRV